MNARYTLTRETSPVAWTLRAGATFITTRSKRQDAITETLNLVADHDSSMAAVFCVDATVLLVYRAVAGCWGYRILGSDRRDAVSGCIDGRPQATFESVLFDAQAHAAQSYGGVVRTLQWTF